MPFGKPKETRKDCNYMQKMNATVKDWGSVDWINSPQDRDPWSTLVNMVMNHRVPYKQGNFSIT
jgi:hypothetical protein